MVASRTEARIEKYVTARRAMLELWAAKQRLYGTALSRFPKSLFKTISKLCHNDATCRIRYLCDIAICNDADRVGDDLFRDRIVDDVCIPAVTHWFYGISHLVPRENVVLNRTKQFTHSDIELFDNVYRLGRNFIESASLLPFLSTRDLTREEERFEKAFETAREKLETASPACSAYLLLQKKLPSAIAGEIVALSVNIA